MSTHYKNYTKESFEENDFSTLEMDIAQSIKQQCVDYCYDLRIIPKIKQECIKKNCFFAYSVDRNEENEIEYIKIVPVFSLVENNQDEAFCELDKLPKTYKAQERHGYQVEQKKKSPKKKHYYSKRKKILEKLKEGNNNV